MIIGMTFVVVRDETWMGIIRGEDEYLIWNLSFGNSCVWKTRVINCCKSSRKLSDAKDLYYFSERLINQTRRLTEPYPFPCNPQASKTVVKCSQTYHS